MLGLFKNININLLQKRSILYISSNCSSDFNRELQIKNSYIYRLENRIKELEEFRNYRCKKITKEGTRCKNSSIGNIERGGYCHIHKNT
jgi:hypothetical protein